ncbi:MAG: hypothetical protein AAF696_02425 [Bacteroidota bacterium]
MNTLKREIHQVLATTYYNWKTSLAMGVILMGMGLLISYIAYINPDSSSEGVPAYVPFFLGIVFFGAGVFSLLPYPMFWGRLKNTHRYNPAAIGFGHIKIYIFAFILVSLFFAIFLSLPKVQNDKTILYVVLAAMLLFLGFYLFQIFKGIRLVINARKFGASYLVCDSSYSLGERIKGVFSNTELHKYSREVELSFRNLKEHPAFDKPLPNKSRNGFATEVLYEVSHRLELGGEQLKFELSIPGSGEPSHYLPYNPTYWEIEVSDSDQEFYSRFLIDVKR